jgi:hypothetical protein
MGASVRGFRTEAAIDQVQVPVNARLMQVAQLCQAQAGQIRC